MKVKSNRGFTLIELVIVIIIIMILAAVAIPRFRDLAGHARDASERATVTAVRQAITIYRAERMLLGHVAPALVNPPVLDNAAVGPALDVNPFFEFVMERGGAITSGWEKLFTPGPEEGRYRGPNAGIYTYEADNVAFLRVP